ncbi:hypothetical protein FKK32_29635, partial [Klebsiella pneumoniae]|nr:hypothetical protein [Klebsiella pneumoniae]
MADGVVAGVGGRVVGVLAVCGHLAAVAVAAAVTVLFRARRPRRQRRVVTLGQLPPALVRRATAGRVALPRWNGGRMPLSSTLADAVLRQLQAADEGRYDSPEMDCVRPLIDIQRRWSGVPTPDVLLAETFKSREGWHLFLYPFAGRQVHLGLAGLLAWRAAQPETGTFSIALNDYGIE